jgi:NitT/TauT family transport system substrate-binding protein
LHERYLPKGSTAHFEMGTKGGVVLVDAVRSGRHAISYLGLAPAAEVINSPTPADVRVVAVAGASNDQCGRLLARTDALGSTPIPDVRSALAWLDGRRVAVPSKTCADLFLRSAVALAPNTVVRPVDQNIDLMAASLERRLVDAVALWEPTASELVLRGLAVPLLDGPQVGRRSAAFVVMREDFIAARPDIALAWLAAERDAQAILGDPAQRPVVIRALKELATNVSEEAIGAALDGLRWRSAPVPRIEYPFLPGGEAVELLAKATAALAPDGRWQSEQLRGDGVVRELAQRVMRDPAPRPSGLRP